MHVIFCTLLNLLILQMQTSAFTIAKINLKASDKKNSIHPAFPVKFNSYKRVFQATRREKLVSNYFRVTICSSSETGKDDSGGSGGDLPMTFLQQRIAEMQTAEVIKDRLCAKNWREGRCTTRAVAVLEDDWIRQVTNMPLILISL